MRNLVRAVALVFVYTFVLAPGAYTFVALSQDLTPEMPKKVIKDEPAMGIASICARAYKQAARVHITISKIAFRPSDDLDGAVAIVEYADGSIGIFAGTVGPPSYDGQGDQFVFLRKEALELFQEPLSRIKK